MAQVKRSISAVLPVLSWGRAYSKQDLASDLTAAIIVTIMLVPQSLAYALLAGLPAEAGIYASIVPILLYAVLGTSKSLAVGPVALISLLSASALGEVADQGTAGYAVAALTLAFLSGVILMLMGIMRLGFLAHFLSHPVIAGFITASGILIGFSQLKHILGVEVHGHSLPGIIGSIAAALGDIHVTTLVIGVLAVAALFLLRRYLGPAVGKLGFAAGVSNAVTKSGPVAVVVLTTFAVWVLDLGPEGVAIVGEVPQSLPPFTLPDLSLDLVGVLLAPAALISIIGFVESISVGQTLAARKRQRIDPNQELIGLGAANMGAAFTGGLPVTGGFARSVVNFDAGAQTPAAGAFTALGLAFAALYLTPLLYFLPKATLAATIIVAVVGLIDLSILRKTIKYSKSDFAAVITTMLLTLSFGVEVGVASGVALSLLLHLHKTSRPHVAEVGLVPGTQHFRNVRRHPVETVPSLLTLRVDESLYFANAHFLNDIIQNRISERDNIRHVVLMLSAVNKIDYSALETLESMNDQFKNMGIGFHLSEVKGPVMDRLNKSSLVRSLNGRVFLSQFDAWVELT